jgi:hypothetical protein
MNAVPFTLEVFGGLGKCDGLLRDEGEAVSLEFQMMDNLAGIIKTGVRTVRIPVKDLMSVTLVKGWLGTSWLGVKIVLQASNMEVLKDVPNMSQGRVELSISRKDRNLAEQFVAGLYQEGEPEAERT